MVFLALTVAALALTVAALVCTSLLATPPAALLRTNFHGKEVPLVGGLVIVSGLLAGEVALAVTYLLDKGGRSAVTFTSRDHWGLLVAALGFFAVGLLDDLAGSGRARGFRGHLRAIIRGELSTGAIKALQEAKNAAGEIRKGDEPLDDPKTSWFRAEIQSYLDAASKAVDDTLAKRARIDLLFGDQSPTGTAATGLTSQLRNMMSALDHRPNSIRDHEAGSMYSRNFDATMEQNEKFNRAARAAIDQTWWERWIERWRIRRER